jgi:hypothetical protein
VRPGTSPVDALFSEATRAGEDAARIRAWLLERDPDEPLLLGLLRMPVPTRLLEVVAGTPPWSGRPRILGGVVLNPKSPRSLALRLISSLFWRDLAEVAASPRVALAVRVHAEAALKERLPEMRLGERVSLGKIATPPVLAALLGDPESKVAQAALLNPRLREEDLLTALRLDTVPRGLLEAVAESHRWAERYNVRLALVLQTRTPLPLALGQISSLVKRDLLRVAGTSSLKPLLRAAALRVAESGRGA